MKVLIIDDNQTNVILLSLLLKKIEDLTTYEFNDPIAALSWCEANEPDLVLVDYMMPKMNGIEFIKSFRLIEGKNTVPIVMVTAQTDNEIRHLSLQASANDFLNKPIDVTELNARVRNMLSLRKAQLQLSNQANLLKEEVKKATAQIQLTEREVIYRLSRAAEYRDPETGAHLVRMSLYSKIIAENLGLSQEDQELILDAAPMHDVGKIGIPDSVLLKPGKLDEEELKIIRLHPKYGKEMLTGSSSKVLQVAEIIAYSHHEKYDGTGYPQSLKGDEIPIYGRIVALADVFDALTSARPYKAAWETDKAVALINSEKGKHFDPKCVEAFFKGWQDVLEVMNKHRDDSLFER